MRKRKTEELHESHERWLVSYADFITLMFAFFVILFATSEQSLEKTKQVENSIRQYLVKMGAMGDSGSKVNQGAEYNTPIESPLKVFPRGSEETQKVQKKIESFMFSQLSGTQLEKLVKDISPDSYGVRITLEADQIFERGGSQMKKSALIALDQVAKLVKESHRRILIEGHSDETQFLSDKYPSVWELSSMQASKVLRYLSKVHKVEESKMATVAFGNQRPLPPYNRRIDILVLTEDLPY
jgi:chemotaxis protein MotB